MSRRAASLYGATEPVRLTSERVAAGLAAIAATAVLVGGLAMQQMAPVREPEPVRASLILIRPPPPAETSPQLEDAEPAPRPAVTVPDRPITPPADAPQTWITPGPAIIGPEDGIPKGLRGLMAKDPCLDPVERLRRDDCPPEYDRQALAGAGAKAVEERHRREQFLAFAERKNCSVNHGCLDDIDLARRPPAAKSATSSLGGMNDTVGRLPPPNWYHVDPGFGD